MEDLFSIFLTCRRHNRLFQPRLTQLVLQRATEHGKESLAIKQISRGANVNESGKGGMFLTPLHSAARGDSPNIIRMLVACGATIDSRAKHSRTPYTMPQDLEIPQQSGCY